MTDPRKTRMERMGTKVAHGLCCYLILFCLSCFAILLSSPSSFAGDADPFAFFENEVRPLLVNRCYKCHSGTKAGGGLSLDTAEGWQKGGESGPAIIVGNPHDSLVIEAINYRSLEMPPQDAGGKLSAEEIAVLTKWIADGAARSEKVTSCLGRNDS